MHAGPGSRVSPGIGEMRCYSTSVGVTALRATSPDSATAGISGVIPTTGRRKSFFLIRFDSPSFLKYGLLETNTIALLASGRFGSA
jgi:hypothetical protein